LELDFEFGTTSHRFRNVLIKTKSNLTGSSFTSVIKNQNPQFVDVSENDYQLQAGSPAIDFGDLQWLDPDTQVDILGNSRVINPDLGAFEKQ